MLNFLKKYITGLRITIIVGIVATFCLIYWGSLFFQQGKILFEKYNFNCYLILAISVCWLFFYVIYLHNQLVKFIKFVLKENKIIKSDMQKLNKNTRNLIVQISTKEDEVA